ncbi:MAG: aspartate 1-decarboxylase [Prevotella sp.]|nr:aspartate 1-decarboxylase [Prevotella sp.]
MEITLLKSKIHRAVVTQADLDYVGSITIDSSLMEAAGIMEYEKVEIADVDNGNRFATYVIAGEAGSGIICVNGAAAHCVKVGDKVIIMAYANMTSEEAGKHHPRVVFVDEDNRITRQTNYEKHGLLSDQD